MLLNPVVEAQSPLHLTVIVGSFGIVQWILSPPLTLSPSGFRTPHFFSHHYHYLFNFCLPRNIVSMTAGIFAFFDHCSISRHRERPKAPKTVNNYLFYGRVCGTLMDGRVFGDFSNSVTKTLFLIWTQNWRIMRLSPGGRNRIIPVYPPIGV